MPTMSPSAVSIRAALSCIALLFWSPIDDFALDELIFDEALATGLGHSLNLYSRCFGDKGDVEDITEG